MKREIKFRVWDKEENKFFEPIYEAYKGHLLDLSISLSGQFLRRTLSLPAEHESCFPDKYELNQFTGLKDKNGVEVYEGDIMKITLEGLGFWEKQKDLERIGKVIYNEDYAGFIVQWEYSKNQHHESLNCDIACTGQVIGNIYEHKNLLE